MARMSATRGGSGGKGREEGAQVASPLDLGEGDDKEHARAANVTTKNTQEGRR